MSTTSATAIHSLQRRHAARWQRDIRLLAVSRGVSMLGFEAGHVALLALVWQMTGSASSAATVLIAAVLARAISAPLAGWCGDRFNRRHVMIISELLAACCFASIALAATPAHVIALVVLGTIAQSVFSPAIDAALPNLVPQSQLTRANAQLGMARTTGHMLGPVLAGVVIALAGARVVFIIDAATSVVAALLIVFLRGDCGGRALASPDATKEERSLAAGFRLIGEDPVLRLLGVSWAAMCVAFALITAAELPLADAFGVGSTGYAAIITCWCVGALIGSWYARRVKAEENGARVLIRNALACSLLFTIAGGTPWFWGVLVCMVCGGASMAIAEVVDTTLQQQRVDDAVRSRVTAAFQSVLSITFVVHLAGGGVLIDTVGPHITYMLSGAWCLIAALGFVFLQRELNSSA